MRTEWECRFKGAFHTVQSFLPRNCPLIPALGRSPELSGTMTVFVPGTIRGPFIY